MNNETNVISIYVSNNDTGWIIHREDLAKEYKKDILHQLELAIEQLKQM